MVDVDPHVAAVKARLDAIAGRTTYVSRAPRDALNALGGGGKGYIVLEPSQGVASTTSFEGSSDQRFVRFATRYFGAGWEDVDAIRTHVRAQLLDWQPTVTGRTAERVAHETEFPVDHDEDMPDPVFYTGDSWTFCTWPA